MSNKSIRMLISVSLNVLIIVLGIYLVFIAGSRAYSFGEKVFNEQSIDSEDNARTVEITITTDIQPKKLAELLYDKGLVSDKTIAFFQIQFSDYKGKFVGGTYEVNTGMTPTDIMEVLSQTDREYMIVNERVVAYINSLNCGNSDICNTIEKEAIADEVPIIRKEMGNLLKVLLQLVQPERILEVGTAVGYSSILMSENMPHNCTITTIENYDKRIPVAKNNFKRAGKEDVITLIEGDALEVLKTLDGPYDFIFMDAAKGQYINYLPDIKRVLRKGGLLISDNILQEGEIVESRYAVTRRNRTIHARIREYVYELTHSEDFVTSIVPIGDGITLSVKQ